jgi:hypothetical protein
MMPRSPIEDRLDDWFQAGPTDAPGQILDVVLAAVPSIPQRRGVWRSPWRVTPMAGFARAIAGIALTVGLAAVAVFFLVQRPGSAPTVGGEGSPSPAAPASQLAVAPPTASPTIAPTIGPSNAPTPEPTIGPCDPANLAARITLWEGAAGSRIADMELTNASSSSCIVRAMARPQLVDGKGSVLIDGAAPAASDAITVGAGQVLRTLVDVANYCGPAPKAPVSVAFILSDGGRIVATPFSATDATVPPCNGPAGSAGDIAMHPWAP